MSRYRWLMAAVAGLAGLASGCRSCNANKCSLLGRSGSDTTGTLTGQGNCPPAGVAAGPVYYSDPLPVGIPTSGGARPENELPMPNQNILPPANPIPIGMPAAMPGKGR